MVSGLISSPIKPDFGGFTFTENSNGDPKQYNCSPALDAFEVKFGGKKLQLRVLTSAKLEEQDRFIEIIGDVVCWQHTDAIYPKFIDYGADSGLTYYLADLEGYSPLANCRLTKQRTVEILGQFLNKLDQAKHFDFDNHLLRLDSLWTDKDDIVIADLKIDAEQNTTKANINLIIDCYLQLSKCSQIETASVSKPQNLNQLKIWVANQYKEPAKLKTHLLDKISNSWPKPNTVKIKRSSKSKLISHPVAFDYESEKPKPSKYFWAALIIPVVILIGILLHLENLNIANSAAKIPRLGSLQSSKTSSKIERAEGYQTPSLTLKEEVALYVGLAQTAREQNHLLDALYHEAEAAKLAPTDTSILVRINNDLNALYQHGHYNYGDDGLTLLYRISLINPRANDIIIRHFQKVGS